jgi:hypothetical protein
MARRAGGEDAAPSQTSENGLYGTHNLKVIDSNPIPATNASLDFARGSAALSEILSGAASLPKNLDLNRLVSPSRRPHDFRDNFADGLVSPPSDCPQPTLFGGRSFMREWGRIGRPRTVCAEIHQLEGKPT